MSIFATPINYNSIIALMQQHSTKIHNIAHDSISISDVLLKVADDDLKAMIAAGDNSLDSAGIDAVFSQIRDWQSAVKNYADNYTGSGTLNDVSYQIAKRVKL